MTTQTGTRMGRRTGMLIGIGAALLALVVLATTAFAAGPGGRFGNRAGNGNDNGNENGGGNFGPQAVVTAVDTGAQTITLAGVPQQIATVKVGANVKLTAIQPDGTSKDAAIGDFKAGSLVRVAVNAQHGGRGGQGGQGTQTPSATVTGLALLPAGQARVEGLVTATSGGTLTIVGMGGLQLTVNTSGATVTRGQNNAASAGDIKVGDRIVAGGTQNGATINATTVRIFDLSNLGRGGANPGGARPTGTASA